MSGGDSIHTRGRSPTKKALLIGIGYSNALDEQGHKLEPIPTSVPNVKALRTFLEESCEYTEITVMTDEEGVKEKYLPKTGNLQREIAAFGKGVQPGDRLVFYFAGHSEQIPCRTGSEMDGMDEAIVALCGRKIKDNRLKELLVKHLPNGCALTAIFDSCNSGTLLDLTHHACNSVYVPWTNKGVRSSNTLPNRVVKRYCRNQSPVSSRPNSTYRKGSGETNVRSRSMAQVMLEVFPDSEHSGTTTDPPEPQPVNGQWCRMLRTTSPERQFECDGLCRTRPRLETAEHPDVISISSSNDGQISWDASTRTGRSISMTTYLINILKKHPNITFSELMTRLNHEVHSFTMRMHGQVQKERRAHRKGDRKHTDSEYEDPEERKGEMDNFQELQLGSITPLDMNRLFLL